RRVRRSAVRRRAEPPGLLPDPRRDGSAHPGDHRHLGRCLRILRAPPRPRGAGLCLMDFLVNWIGNIPGFAVPFALAALGLILTEKSGVLSLGAEGFMLMGAMAGVGAVIVTGEPHLALVAAALAAALISLIFAGLVVALRVN